MRFSQFWKYVLESCELGVVVHVDGRPRSTSLLLHLVHHLILD